MQDKFLISKTDDAKDLELPRYMTEGASGMDLRANVENDITLAPGKIKLIKTGVKISLPKGFEAQIRPRSGLALKYGVTMVNAPGTIDRDYRGEIGVIMTNLGGEDFVIERGSRIAQLVICPVATPVFIETDSLPSTDRNGGGFGHTGA